MNEKQSLKARLIELFGNIPGRRPTPELRAAWEACRKIAIAEFSEDREVMAAMELAL